MMMQESRDSAPMVLMHKSRVCKPCTPCLPRVRQPTACGRPCGGVSAQGLCNLYLAKAGSTERWSPLAATPGDAGSAACGGVLKLAAHPTHPASRQQRARARRMSSHTKQSLQAPPKGPSSLPGCCQVQCPRQAYTPPRMMQGYGNPCHALQ